MQLKPCSCFNCRALPSGTESGVAFCCAPAAGEPHPRAWKAPTLLMQTLWGGSPPEAIRKALPPAEDMFWGLNSTANGELVDFLQKGREGPVFPHPSKRAFSAATLTTNWFSRMEVNWQNKCVCLWLRKARLQEHKPINYDGRYRNRRPYCWNGCILLRESTYHNTSTTETAFGSSHTKRKVTNMIIFILFKRKQTLIQHNRRTANAIEAY